MIMKFIYWIRKLINGTDNCGMNRDKVIKDDSNRINDKVESNQELYVNSNIYELPNQDLLDNDEMKNIIETAKTTENIPILLGKSKTNMIIENLNDMPNMLIGGTVMSGKTSFLNTIICSMLLTKKPDELKIILFDSKKIDYSIYNGLPHLLFPVLSDSKKLELALNNTCSEIKYRLDLLNQTANKTISNYNKTKSVDSKLPSIVIIIDDITTLNMSDSTNEAIEYITANGWSVNVYVIIVANHPSSKVISTVSKSNFPARLSFKVASNQASQIIINESGAERLKGFGEALYTSRLTNGVIKLEVPNISDEVISKIVDSCKKNGWINVYKLYKKHIDFDEYNEKNDPMYEEIVKFVVTTGKASASLIQRKYKLGYNRSARIIDLLEERGIIGPANGSKPREVLVKLEDKEDDW